MINTATLQVLFSRIVVLTCTLTVGFFCSSAAQAISYPQVNPNALVADGVPHSPIPMRQNTNCTVLSFHQERTKPNLSNQRLLNLDQAWKFSQGDGQSIAILDTGIEPQPLLPRLVDGGDYIAGTSGLGDCDGRGTLVAGIVGAKRSLTGFVGVAPMAKIISIRITSSAWSPSYVEYGPAQSNDELHSPDPAIRTAALAISNLSHAIVHAANMGATVILIPTAYCLPVEKTVNQDALGAAIRYASVTKNSIIVSAAGDIGSSNSGAACANNPPVTPNTLDYRNWSHVETISLPSLWRPYVLSVASLNNAGNASSFTMTGPWVSIAAPGENISSLSNTPQRSIIISHLINSQGKHIPISGSSYAAAYVAGIVALVRSKYPTLNWHQIIKRIIETAHAGPQTPSNTIGAGTIDPTAAVTWDLPPGNLYPNHAPVLPITLPPPPLTRGSLPTLVAVIGSITTISFVLILSVVLALRRKKIYGK